MLTTTVERGRVRIYNKYFTSFFLQNICVSNSVIMLVWMNIWIICFKWHCKPVVLTNPRKKDILFWRKKNNGCIKSCYQAKSWKFSKNWKPRKLNQNNRKTKRNEMFEIRKKYIKNQKSEEIKSKFGHHHFVNHPILIYYRWNAINTGLRGKIRGHLEI